MSNTRNRFIFILCFTALLLTLWPQKAKGDVLFSCKIFYDIRKIDLSNYFANTDVVFIGKRLSSKWYGGGQATSTYKVIKPFKGVSFGTDTITIRHRSSKLDYDPFKRPWLEFSDNMVLVELSYDAGRTLKLSHSYYRCKNNISSKKLLAYLHFYKFRYLIFSLIMLCPFLVYRIIRTRKRLKTRQ